MLQYLPAGRLFELDSTNEREWLIEFTNIKNEYFFGYSIETDLKYLTKILKKIPCL